MDEAAVRATRPIHRAADGRRQHAGAGAGADGPGANVAGGDVRLRRPRRADAGHARHPVRDRVDRQIVHEPGADARARGREPRPPGAGRALPALVRGAVGVPADHRPSPLEPHGRHHRRHRPDAGRRVPGLGAARDGGGHRAGDQLPLLERRVQSARPGAGAADRTGVRRRDPLPRPRPARHDGERTGDHQRPAAPPRGRLRVALRRPSGSPEPPAGPRHLARNRKRRRQHRVDARGHGGLLADAAQPRPGSAGSPPLGGRLRRDDPAHHRDRGRAPSRPATDTESTR